MIYIIEMGTIFEEDSFVLMIKLDDLFLNLDVRMCPRYQTKRRNRFTSQRTNNGILRIRQDLMNNLRSRNGGSYNDDPLHHPALLASTQKTSTLESGRHTFPLNLVASRKCLLCPTTPGNFSSNSKIPGICGIHGIL